MLKRIEDEYCIEVDQSVYNIYNFIHIVDLVDEIKKLSNIDRFILCNYVIATYCSSDDKISDSLLENLNELKTEVLILDQNEDNDNKTSNNSYYDDLIKSILIIEDIKLEDIKLSYQGKIIPELSKEESLIRLRDQRLDELFSK